MAEQPRDPKGTSTGGQWASAGGGGGGGRTAATLSKGDYKSAAAVIGDLNSDVDTANALVAHLERKRMAARAAGEDTQPLSLRIARAKLLVTGSASAPADLPVRYRHPNDPGLNKPHALNEFEDSILYPGGKPLLTQAEDKARWRYIGDGYAGINGSLRNQTKTTAEAEQNIALLDSAFERAPGLPREVEVHRGVEGDFAEKLSQLEPGATFTDHGFTSTSLKEGIAKEFQTQGGTKGARVVIRVPKGTKAIPGERREFELILNRGTTYRVVGTKRGKIILEVVA